MRLKPFHHELGRAMFGEEWDEKSRPGFEPSSSSYVYGSDSKVMQVVRQIALAIITGDIQAALILNSRPLPNVDKRDLIDDDVCASRGPTYYPLSSEALSEYWPSLITEWETSQVRVDARHLHEPEGRSGRRPPNAIRVLGRASKTHPYCAGQMVNGPAVILRADSALRAMFPLDRLPSPDHIQRYAAFDNALVDEVVIAAWRSIALRGPESDTLKPHHIVEYMHEYLIYQAIDGDKHRVSNGLMRAIADKIFLQWSRRDSSSRVNLNSTPRKRPGKPTKKRSMRSSV